MGSREELYQALRNADAAGDVAAASKLAAYIQSLPAEVQQPATALAPSEKSRSFGESAKDIAAGIVSGAGSLVQFPGQLYGLVTGDLSDTGALGLGKDISKYGEEMKSAGLKAREAERAQKIKTAEQSGQWEAFKTAFGETIKDPALLTSFLAEQAPQLLVPFGAAKVAQIGTAAKAAAAAQGLVGEAATKAAGEITKAAAERGTRAAIGAGAVQQGADVGAQAYEDIYKELKSKGATDADAAQGAINLARAAGASGALISILAQRLPGARTLEESFAGVPGTGGRLLGAAKGALGEGLSEVVEETGGKFGANLAMQGVKPEQSLLEGLGQTAGMAAVGGVGMGGVTGLARRHAAEEAKPAEAPAATAEPQKAEAEATKPATAETGIVRPEEDVTPLTREEQQEFARRRQQRLQRPTAEELLGEVRGQIQTAPPTTPQDVARVRDDHETAVINSLLEQDKKMQSVSDLARLNLERMSQTESMEAATQDADRRVREARLMGRVQSLIDQNIPFASTAIADINRKFDLIGEAPLDDSERARVQNIMTMAQGFTNFVKLPSLPVREQDRFAENQAMEALIKERKPRGEVSSKPIRAEALAPSPVVGEAPVSTRVEEGRAVRPQAGVEPSIAEDRQRAESVVPPAEKPVKPAVPAAAKPISPPIPSEQQARQQHAVQGLGIVEIPVQDIQLSEDVPQFKSDADKAGVVEPLEGKFERTGVAPIQVWRRKNGRLEVISGRHRLDLAQRTGETTIPAQIHDEASGFDTTKAATLDAELNIRDGQGKVKDYVVYFEKSGITEDEAKSRGLLGRALGKRAWTIASKGSPELIAAHRGGIIDDAAAEAIANAAPGDARLQAVGIKAIQDGNNTANAVNMMQAVRAMAQERAVDTTSDMFGFDDSAIREAEDMAKIATQRQSEIDNRLRAISGASKRPEIAKKEGIDIRDPEALKTRIDELKKERAAWDNWATNPDLVAEVRDTLRGTTGEVDGKKSLRATTARQVSDFEQTLRTTLNKFGLKDVGVKLIDGMREEGSYAQQLIRIAADSDNPIRTLRHEAIHAMRELGFFTPQQWQSLSKMAKDKWIDQYLKQRNVDGKPLKASEESRYDAYMREYDGDMEKITEEAVADAFADFDATKPPAGLMSALLTRLRNLFQAIKSALTKVESPDQIFGKVERGELAAAQEARPAEEVRKSLRKEEPRPTPTTAGQSALDTINQLGMGVKEPEPGMLKKLGDGLKRLGENPTLTIKDSLAAFGEWMSKRESEVLSADAKFEADVRKALNADTKNIKEILGALLSISQSGAVHADAVATQAVLTGKAEFDPEIQKWVAVEAEHNMKVLAAQLDKIAEKYGLTKEEATRVAHTYFVAKNYNGIIERNAKLEAEAEALKAEGKTDEARDKRDAMVFVSDEQAAMVQPGLDLVKTIPELAQMVETWQGIRKNFVKTLVDSYLWSPEYATAMLDNIDYVPFYRERLTEEDEGPQMIIRGLQVKAKEMKLKGSETAVNDVFDNMAMWMQYAMNRAIRNHKALQMIDVATDLKLGDKMMAEKVSEPKRGMNIVRVWRDGKQEFYNMADPYYLPAFQSLGAVAIPAIKFFTDISNILRRTVVMYPLFSAGQLTQDSVVAMFASGLKPKYALKIPFLAVQEFIKTYRGTSDVHQELTKFGAVGVRDFNAAVARQDAEILAGIKMPRGGKEKLNFLLERIAMSADNAVRQAVYRATMDAGLSKAEAVEKAFEIINFRRRGSSKLLNLMGQTVPFFYAYLSAQRVAYRTLTGVGISPSERKAALETLAMTSAAVMALSFLYAMANGEDEAYEKTPDTVRNRSLIIPGTNGVRIPLRPDFFLFPKVIAEHTYHLLADNGLSDPGKFKKGMGEIFANAVLSPNVVPQIAKPTLEASINYSFFEGKPIVGFFEKNKEAGRQFSESTSEFAKFLGQYGASPQVVDHLVRGYFGSVGGLFLWGTNFMIDGMPGVPRQDITWQDAVKTLPGVGAFKQKSTENALKVDFYELRDEVEKAKNTFDDIKRRSPEGLQDFIDNEKNYAKLALEKRVTKITDELSKIRRAIQQIAAAPEDRFSAQEKGERIEELREIERTLLKAVDVRGMREKAMM